MDTKNVAPLYCPIYIDGNKRDEIRKYMRQKNILLPVIWPKPQNIMERICTDVQWIFDHILAIPCDQRYSSEDMESIVLGIKEYFS